MGIMGSYLDDDKLTIISHDSNAKSFGWNFELESFQIIMIAPIQVRRIFKKMTRTKIVVGLALQALPGDLIDGVGETATECVRPGYYDKNRSPS